MMLNMRMQSLSRPSRSIRKYLAAMVVGASVLCCSPQRAAASSDEDVQHYDARVQGYTPDVELKSWGVGGCWVMLIAMAVGCTAVIFKDSKRSHLD
jgi:hypothetical protein